LSYVRNWIRPPQWPLHGIGHNGGPPLDDEPPGKRLYVRHAWKKAHAKVWQNPPRDIMLFRLKRAKAAGLTYHEYMLKLLDDGRYPQAGDGVPDKSKETTS
jgi:hypothetical protein